VAGGREGFVAKKGNGFLANGALGRKGFTENGKTPSVGSARRRKDKNLVRKREGSQYEKKINRAGLSLSEESGREHHLQQKNSLVEHSGGKKSELTCIIASKRKGGVGHELERESRNKKG